MKEFLKKFKSQLITAIIAILVTATIANFSGVFKSVKDHFTDPGKNSKCIKEITEVNDKQIEQIAKLQDDVQLRPTHDEINLRYDQFLKKDDFYQTMELLRRDVLDVKGVVSDRTFRLNADTIMKPINLQLHNLHVIIAKHELKVKCNDEISLGSINKTYN